MYDLSFSEDFFLSPGEPYDIDSLCLNVDGKPISVWSAIHVLMEDESNWNEMCKDLFPNTKPEFIMPEAIYDMIRETNSCDTLTQPIRVYIDKNYNYWVTVYE